MSFGAGASLYPAWLLRQSGSSLLTGLVSYWNLDEQSGTRDDAVGSNDLTDNNTVGYVAGKNGNAANLVKINTEFLSRSVGPWQGDAVTISAWLKVPTLPGASSSFVIWNKAGASWSVETTWVLGTNVNKLRFFVCNGTTFFPVQAGTDMLADSWYHVIATYDDLGDRKPRMRLNGAAALVGSTALTGTWVKPASGVLLFARIPPASTCVDVVLDEVALWNRVLTDEEVAELYAAGAGKFYPF